MSKTPKIGTFQKDVIKSPKSVPMQNYQEMYPAWRIGKLDLNGEWGYDAFHDIFELSIDDELENFLCENNLEQTLNLFLKYKGQTFSSIKSFFKDLSNCHELNIKDLKYLANSVKKTFFVKKIHPKLLEYERCTWREIESMQYGNKGKTKNHFISVEKLAPEAKNRLKELKMDDVDELFSLRLEGKLRIFGIRDLNVLNIVWIDPEHEICPTQK